MWQQPRRRRLWWPTCDGPLRPWRFAAGGATRGAGSTCWWGQRWSRMVRKGSGQGEDGESSWLTPWPPQESAVSAVRAHLEATHRRDQAFEPALVIVSAGYDALEEDELATASLQPEDYGRMGKRLQHVFGGKVASGLGGGYNLQVLTMAEVPKPSAEMIREGKNKGKTMIVKVEACSISMGDTYMLEGNCDLMLNPKLPFVPSMDICGVVEDIAEGSEDFKVGDRVIATNGMEPVGGMAEYAVVHTKFAGKAPPNVEPVQAAALPNSPITAMDAVKAAKLKEGDRVMVLGGSGGVGSSLVQLAKDAKASFVATTSTAEAMCLSLGADVVINYREKNWYEDERFKAEPFDVVFDCVGWRDEWKESGRTGALKNGWNGGRYITIATADNPQIHTVWQATKMFVPVLWRTGWTGINRLRPRYKLIISEPKGKDLAEVSDLVASERLKPVLEPASPFPFTIEGVKAAFKLQGSRHAHGKVVVKIAHHHACPGDGRAEIPRVGTAQRKIVETLIRGWGKWLFVGREK